MMSKIKYKLLSMRYQLQQSIKDIAFFSLINKWVFLTYMCVFLGLLALYFQFHDSWGTLDPLKYSALMEGFLEVNSILVGVIISLLILTFQVLNDHYGSFAFRAIFKSTHNRGLITLFLCNFFATSYAISYWDQNFEGQSLYFHVLFYIVLASNTLLILSAFPLAFLSLRSAGHTSNVDTIVEDVSDKWIAEYAEYHTNRMNASREIFPIRFNPIEELTDIARKAIQSDDFETFRLVCQRLYDRLKESSEEASEYRFFYFEYCDYIDNLFIKALRSDEAHFIGYLANKRVELEQYFVQSHLDTSNKSVWNSNLSYITIHFQLYTEKSLEFGRLIHFESIIRAYYRISEFYLKEVLPAELPEYDKAKFEDYKDIKFFASNLFGSSIKKFAELLSKSVKVDGFESLFRLFALQSVVFDSECSDSTKKGIVHFLEHAKRDSFKHFVDSGPARINYLTFPFGNTWTAIHEELKQLKHVQMILNGLFFACEYACQKGKLNNTMLNLLRFQASGLLTLREEGVKIDKPFRMCIAEFDKLRAMLDTTNELHEKDMYLKAHEYLQSLEKESTSDGFMDNALDSVFSDIYQKFAKLTEFTEDVHSGHYIRDEEF